jgi:CheY-like chemotaxis protein
MLSDDTLSGWVVLAIDDDPDSLNIIEALLNFHGAATHTATNGQKGLELARSLQPTLIVTDMSMPIMTGWDMVGELKKDASTTDIPVIALTAHAMVGDRERAIEAGCENYLSKPLRPDTFINDLMALLVEIPKLAAKFTRTSDS